MHALHSQPKIAAAAVDNCCNSGHFCPAAAATVACRMQHVVGYHLMCCMAHASGLFPDCACMRLVFTPSPILHSLLLTEKVPQMVPNSDAPAS